MIDFVSAPRFPGGTFGQFIGSLVAPSGGEGISFGTFARFPGGTLLKEDSYQEQAVYQDRYVRQRCEAVPTAAPLKASPAPASNQPQSTGKEIVRWASP